ncbi:hypothetical protein GZ55_03000 [Bacillus pumilus]|nr:hypothetical protein [Bacillus pumilus]QKN76920.1 hypothetical protein GZ55_03000 [Bacillus pumilus]
METTTPTAVQKALLRGKTSKIRMTHLIGMPTCVRHHLFILTKPAEHGVYSPMRKQNV